MYSLFQLVLVFFQFSSRLPERPFREIFLILLLFIIYAIPSRLETNA